MRYSKLAEAYEDLESTTKRLAMTDILVRLFKETPVDVIDKVIYLTQGKLHPDWMGLPELGLAEKMAARAIAVASGRESKDVLRESKKIGDIGAAAKSMLSERKTAPLAVSPLTVSDVYNGLDAISKESGKGSADRKIRRLSTLLTNASPGEAKYIIRTVTGKLRLGVGDMTVLDALAVAFADKGKRPTLERAYNVSSDLGYIAHTIAAKGIVAVREIHLNPGRPVRMMLAQRLPSVEEIMDKLGGKVAAEYKLDGERVQIHKIGRQVKIFSRRLENISSMYPDIISLSIKYVKARDAIVEGECVAIDPDTNELRPFQVLMQRRRKHGIKKMMEEVPVAIYLFDCLYVDGDDLTRKPYLDRRSRLKSVIKEGDRFRIDPSLVTGKIDEIMSFFHKSILEGCEGVVVKSTSPESVYRAGARSWLWVKLKRSYQSKMIEPVDLTVVGALMGRGRRAGTYGALLGAVYDDENDEFQTVCKVGSGYTDKVLESLPKKFKPYAIDHRHPRVNSILKADVWFTPAVVIEVIGDEITLSPIHTCAFDKIKKGAGLGIRFPRFTGRWRTDKSAEQSTTVKEVVGMYRQQLTPKKV